MKDKKILILIVFVVALTFIILSVWDSSVKTKARLLLYEAESQDVTVARLETQIKQARDLIRAFVELNISLQKSLDMQRQISEQERVRIFGLEQKLKETSAHNETLTNELSQAKVGLELTQPIRQRLAQIEDSLAKLDIRASKVGRLKRQLQALNKTLESINHKIPNLIKEEVDKKQSMSKELNVLSEQLKMADKTKAFLEQKSLDLEKTVEGLEQANSTLNEELIKLDKALKEMQDRQAQLIHEREEAIRQKDEAVAKQTQQVDSLALLIQRNQELENKLNSLRVELEQLNKEYVNLKEGHQNAQAILAKNETELGRRANSILNLQERITELEAKLDGVQLKSKDMEKECATLREQNVAVQLEREELKGQLKLRLNDLENQLAQITDIIKPAASTQGTAGQKQEGTKKIEVELFPQTQNLEVK